MTQRRCLVSLGAALCLADPALAAPRHDICQDLGNQFTWGISSFGAAEGWLADAYEDHGIEWTHVYHYTSGEDVANRDAQSSFVELKVDEARSVGAMPVLTFYQFLRVADQNDVGGSEAEQVQAVLQDPDMMREYLNGYVWLLDQMAELGGPMLLHVEPDSWGFMMWDMGVEGNADAASVPAMVGSSGFAEVAGMADDAGSLGRAMVQLRDEHAPEVRLGWHASNFRVGTRPDVVTGFFSSMGDWDVLLVEKPHNEADEDVWWDAWDAEKTQINLDWFTTLTSETGLPVLLWQLPIGSSDFHMLEQPPAYPMLKRYAESGIIGGMFSHRGDYGADPNEFRATEGPFGNIPPSGHPAGGTAADLRTRLLEYAANPFTLPSGTICADGMVDADTEPVAKDPDPMSTDAENPGKPLNTESGANSGPKDDPAPSGTADAGANPAASGDTQPVAASDGGCNCRVQGRPSGSDWAWLMLSSGLVLRRAPRADATRSRPPNRSSTRKNRGTGVFR